MKKLIACMLIAITLIGCGSEDENIDIRETEFSNRFIRTNPDIGRDGENLGYLIDSKTGVVYLEYNGYRAHAITVMLNANGTPVTKDQLELEV